MEGLIVLVALLALALVGVSCSREQEEKIASAPEPDCWRQLSDWHSDYCSLYSSVEEVKGEINDFLIEYPNKELWTKEQSKNFASLRSRTGKLIRRVFAIRKAYNDLSEKTPPDFDWQGLPEQL